MVKFRDAHEIDIRRFGFCGGFLIHMMLIDSWIFDAQLIGNWLGFGTLRISFEALQSYYNQLSKMYKNKIEPLFLTRVKSDMTYLS